MKDQGVTHGRATRDGWWTVDQGAAAPRPAFRGGYGPLPVDPLDIGSKGRTVARRSCGFLPTHHPPPHFHARYGDDEAVVSIEDGGVLHGGIPLRALGLVREWVALHREELVSNWERARKGQPLLAVPPLA